MKLHNKTFLSPNDPYSDQYFSFYFDDCDTYMSSAFAIGDGTNAITFSGDREDDLAVLDQLIAGLMTFREIAAGRFGKAGTD